MLEAEHMLLGVFDGTRTPFLLNEGITRSGGGLVIGNIGSGKTMRVTAGLMYPIAVRRRSTLLVCDMKGDRLFAKFCAWLARAADLPYVTFSNVAAYPGMPWNPLRDSAFTSLSVEDKADILVQSFGFEFGDVYGASHFATQMKEVVAAAFRLAPDIRSFRELLGVVTREKFFKQAGLAAKGIKDANDAIAVVRWLASIPEINRTGGPNIDIGAALATPTVVYAHLSPSWNETTARILGRLPLRLAYRQTRLRDSAEPHVYAVVDELNVLLQRALELPIKQGRDAGMTFLATMQNLSDARTQDKDFTDTLVSNLKLKIFCTAADYAGREYVTKVGGKTFREEVSRTKSASESSTGRTVSVARQYREVEVDRFGPDEIERLNSQPNLVFVEAKPDTGATVLNGPQFVEIEFPLCKAEFDEVKAFELPKPPAPADEPPSVEDRSEPDDEDGDDPPPAPPPPAPKLARPTPKPKREKKPRGKKPFGRSDAGKAALERLKKHAERDDA